MSLCLLGDEVRESSWVEGMALCSWKKPVAAAVPTGGRRWREGSSQGHSRLSIRDGTQAHKDLCPEGLE